MAIRTLLSSQPTLGLREHCSHTPDWIGKHDMFVDPKATLSIAVMSVVAMQVGSNSHSLLRSRPPQATFVVTYQRKIPPHPPIHAAPRSPSSWSLCCSRRSVLSGTRSLDACSRPRVSARTRARRVAARRRWTRWSRRRSSRCSGCRAVRDTTRTKCHARARACEWSC